MLKDAIDKDKRAGKFHEKIHIKDDATGHDFHSLLKNITDDTVGGM